MKEDEFDEFITEMGKKAEPTIGGGRAAVDRRESGKEGRNESEHRFIRASSTSAGLVCGGRKREGIGEGRGRKATERSASWRDRRRF